MSRIISHANLGAKATTLRVKPVANSNFEPLNICLGFSTSAMFDMSALDEQFRKWISEFMQQGIDEQNAQIKAGKYYEGLITQKRREGFRLMPGPTAVLAKKLLLLNGIAGIHVSIRLISRNHPDVLGLVYDSLPSNPWLLDEHGLSLIKGGSFTSGEPISPNVVRGHGVDILLATNPQDVIASLADGISAGNVSHLAKSIEPKDIENVTFPITIGFDFDRVLGFARHPKKSAKDAEDYFLESIAKHGFEKGLRLYQQHMQRVGYEVAEITHLCEFLKKLYEVQNRIGKDKIKIRIVTARGTDAAPQIISTLEALGAAGVELHALGGVSKEPFIKDCDIFFDDIPKNLKGTRLGVTVPAEAARAKQKQHVAGTGLGGRT